MNRYQTTKYIKEILMKSPHMLEDMSKIALVNFVAHLAYKEGREAERTQQNKLWARYKK